MEATAGDMDVQKGGKGEVRYFGNRAACNPQVGHALYEEVQGTDFSLYKKQFFSVTSISTSRSQLLASPSQWNHRNNGAGEVSGTASVSGKRQDMGGGGGERRDSAEPTPRKSLDSQSRRSPPRSLPPHKATRGKRYVLASSASTSPPHKPQSPTTVIREPSPETPCRTSTSGKAS